MNNDKLNFVFYPFLKLLFGLIIGCSFLNWLLVMKLELITVDGMWLGFIFPALLSAIFAWKYTYPKLRALRLVSIHFENIYEAYASISFLLITIPVVIAQSLLSDLTGDLISLNAISEINTKEKVRYYEVENLFIAKEKGIAYNSFGSGGGSKESIGLYINVLFPIYQSAKDTIHNEPLAWYGVRHNYTVSKSLSQEKLKEKVSSFAKEINEKLPGKDLYDFVYFERLLPWRVHFDDFQSTLRAHGFDKNIEAVNILVPVNEPFEARTGTTPFWLLGFISFAVGLWYLMLIPPKVSQVQLRRLRAKKPYQKPKYLQEESISWQESLSPYIPTKEYLVTPSLFWINIGLILLIFFTEINSELSASEELLAWGASNKNTLIEEGEWWRLLSSLFLHNGGESFALFIVPLTMCGLEFLIGSRRYFIIYVLSGIAGVIVSLFWHSEGFVAVGALPALFGILGAAVMATYRFSEAVPFQISAALVKGLKWLSILLLANISFVSLITPGVDYPAQLAGLFTGIVVFLLLPPKRESA